MGILDNVTAAVNRGMESAGREAERLKLKNQINEINKRRQQLAAQLGASLYYATRDDPALRVGRGELYDGIAACDEERADCQRKIDELDAMALAATEAASNYKCSVCGSTVAGGDLFCSGCGTPAAQAKAAGPVVVTGVLCASCGAPMKEGDLFCMSCGTKVDRHVEEPVAVEEKATVPKSDAGAPQQGVTAPAVPAPPEMKGGE